eukprot:1161798-Pelagomonas_calceolata.AAC.16
MEALVPDSLGDDVEAEFAADKAAEVGAELPHIEEPSTLPGWGVWQDQQRNPKWMKQAKEKAQRCVAGCMSRSRQWLGMQKERCGGVHEAG